MTDDEEEEEVATPLQRLGDACHELISALGSITAESVKGGVLRVGRVMNRGFYARRYKHAEVTSRVR